MSGHAVRSEAMIGRLGGYGADADDESSEIFRSVLPITTSPAVRPSGKAGALGEGAQAARGGQ